MSHDRGWRAACLVTDWIPEFHLEGDEVARGVTAMVVGSGALLGPLSLGFDGHLKTCYSARFDEIHNHVKTL